MISFEPYEKIGDKIQRIFFEKQLKAENEKQRRINYISSISGEFAKITEMINQIGLKLVKASLFSNADDEKKYLQELDDLIQKRKSILRKLNYNEDYLDSIYECNKCMDTGFISNQEKIEVCTCRSQLYIEFLYEQSNLKEIFKEHNFLKFDLTYYTDEIDKNEGISPRANIKKVLKTAWEFITNFEDSKTRNLLIYGATGLGKTFLAHCIAKEMLDRKKTVLFLDSISFFEILRERLNKIVGYYNDKSDLYKALEDVDLLIIDDLGNEGDKAKPLHGIFQTLLDTRFTNNKKMIITTNHNLGSLTEMYKDKNVGRIQEYFIPLHIFGTDIRVLKTIKEMNKSLTM